MNKVKVFIWGRFFELYVSYQNYPGEDVTKNQERTTAAIPLVDFDGALDAVKEYIYKNNSDDINENQIENIFRYVMPKSILVTREKDLRVLALMCNYRFDIEHGMAVVFENERYKAVGPEDLIL